MLMKGALRLIYPPQCMACAATVDEDGGLCPACWRDAEFISGASCSQCGAPLPHGGGADDEGAPFACDDCLARARPWVGARAAVVYRGTGRKLAMMLKHGDRIDLAPHLGDWVARAAEPLVRPEMIVTAVPVPLRRLMRRKYNQASLLSARVARAYGLVHYPDLLRRTRNSPPQDQRSLEARFENQEGAIAMPARHAALVRGRPVLLVDDVMASGATLAACADCLAGHGAGPISVAVLARAVKDT